MVRVRKPQYAGETQLDSFCKLFDIHIYPAHNYQLLSGHWGQFRICNQGHFFHALQLSRQRPRCNSVRARQVESHPALPRNIVMQPMHRSSSPLEALQLFQHPNMKVNESQRQMRKKVSLNFCT